MFSPFLCAIFEKLKLEVQWIEKTKQIIVKDENSTLTLTIDSNIAQRNGENIELSAKPQIYKGVTYVPLRFLSESLEKSVSWDGNTKTVSIYTLSSDASYIDTTVPESTDYVPYSTTDPATLLQDILNGNVVYFDNQYWATPEYANSLNNTEVVYEHDISDVEYDPAERYELRDFDDSDIKWTTVVKFEKMDVAEYNLGDLDVSKLEKSSMSGYYKVYVFYNQGTMGTNIVYCVTDMTDSFFNTQDGYGVFNGIQMKKENGILFFHYQDLIDHGINPYS